MSKKLDLIPHLAALVLAIAVVIYFAIGGPAVMVADGLSAFVLTPTVLVLMFAALLLGLVAGAVTTYTDWRSLVSWTATSAGFGLRPIYDQSGRVRARCYVNGIVSGYAGATLYQYSPVKLVTTSGANRLEVPATTDDIVGVLDGVEYTDSNGRRQYSKYWPSGLTPLAGTSWNVYVWDDPRTIFEIQVSGAISNWGTYGGIGQQIDFLAGSGAGGISGGSTVTQISSAQADVARISTSAQRQLRVIDKARYVDNDWGDAFPIVQVQIAQHQYIGNKVAV